MSRQHIIVEPGWPQFLYCKDCKRFGKWTAALIERCEHCNSKNVRKYYPQRFVKNRYMTKEDLDGIDFSP